MVQVRILFATDLHGSDLMFKKLVAAVQMYNANAVIIGGDITGKGIVPIVRRGDLFETSIYGTHYTARSQEELSGLLKTISNLGFYHTIIDEKDVSSLDNPDVFEKYFVELSTERIRSWINYAKAKLRSARTEFYMMPGNDDPLYIDKALEDDYVINPANKILEILGGRYVLVGYDKTNITPWKCPRDVNEDLIEKELTDLLSKAQRGKPVILCAHCPPYGTLLDRAPKLDKDLKPVVSGGAIVTEHVGCVSVRRMIEKYQPLLGLHGHIHESRAIDRIGKTVIINPGSAYNEGVLFIGLIILENGKIKSTMLLKG